MLSKQDNLAAFLFCLKSIFLIQKLNSSRNHSFTILLHSIHNFVLNLRIGGPKA